MLAVLTCPKCRGLTHYDDPSECTSRGRSEEPDGKPGWTLYVVVHCGREDMAFWTRSESRDRMPGLRTSSWNGKAHPATVRVRGLDRRPDIAEG